jgi:hypothetical protein
MKEIGIHFFGCLVLLLLATEAASSQNDSTDSPSLAWVNFGIGFSGTKNFFGLGGIVNTGYVSEIGLCSVRFIDADKATVDPATLTSTRLTHLNELSAMYGLNYRTSLFSLSASSGIGLVWFKEQDNSGNRSFSSVGIPIDAQAFVTPLKVLAFGVTLFSNLNAKSTFTGLMFCVRIGKVK